MDIKTKSEFVEIICGFFKSYFGSKVTAKVIDDVLGKY